MKVYSILFLLGKEILWDLDSEKGEQGEWKIGIIGAFLVRCFAGFERRGNLRVVGNLRRFIIEMDMKQRR